jgi:hypothetical protein
MEYITQRTIEQVASELMSELPTLDRSLLLTHALVMTEIS